MLDPITGLLLVQQTRDLAHSALPDAPVRPDPEPARTRRLRRRAALTLYWLADRIEPAPRVSAGTL
jgi:hypothetical protein